jgi:hypothetical protein
VHSRTDHVPDLRRNPQARPQYNEPRSEQSGIRGVCGFTSWSGSPSPALTQSTTSANESPQREIELRTTRQCCTTPSRNTPAATTGCLTCPHSPPLLLVAAR